MTLFSAGPVRAGRKRQHGEEPKMLSEIARLLKKLCEAPGPAGQEQKVREIIAHEIKPCCKELREDPLGNLVARVGPKDGYKVGILAHMDEVGLIVSRISDNGLLGFELLGMIDSRCLLGCPVNVVALDGLLIPGVIGNKSRHLQTEEEARAQVSHKNLWIDIGAGSRQEVLRQGIGIGSGVVFSTPFHAYDNGAIMGKALDNRISCAVLIEALRRLAPVLKETTVLGMFTIQEEIGAKGAQVVAFDERPVMTITLDNVPTQNPNEVRPGDVDLNQGPVIRIFDYYPPLAFGMFTHPLVKDRLMEVATRENIRFQADVLTATYLDSSQAHLTAGGIPGGSICFPRRYSHSPVEMSHLNDIRSGLDLLVKFVESLEVEPIRFGKNY
jgi:tetrahedral aminopeptidase